MDDEVGDICYAGFSKYIFKMYLSVVPPQRFWCALWCGIWERLPQSSSFLVESLEETVTFAAYRHAHSYVPFPGTRFLVETFCRFLSSLSQFLPSEAPPRSHTGWVHPGSLQDPSLPHLLHLSFFMAFDYSVKWVAAVSVFLPSMLHVIDNRRSIITAQSI